METAESLTSTEATQGLQEPSWDHLECGSCIALAVLAGYAWGRWDALKPLRTAAWDGLTEPIRHLGLVTVTCLQFRTLIAKAQKFDQAYDLWSRHQESKR